MARDLLSRPDSKVKFFGALTIIIKLNNERYVCCLKPPVWVFDSRSIRSSSLSTEDADELLQGLVGWYLEALHQADSPLVVRKLSSALATFFLHFHRLWGQFIHHLAICLVSGQPCSPASLKDAQSSVSVIERLNPSQTRAILWVLSSVLEDTAKYDLNSANKSVILRKLIVKND